MNKIIKNLFLVLLPFYPLWAWFSYSVFKKPIHLFVSICLFPVAICLFVYVKKKLPIYLKLFICFTFYHVLSLFINDAFPKDLFPKGTDKIYFLLIDPNVLACLFFIIIEYTTFDRKFLRRMNKCILVIVVISLAVSLVQIKIPTFLFNVNADEELSFIGESRNFSIYSWTNLPSVGISFPILVSILLSEFNPRKLMLPSFIAFSGAVVSFLTRTRFAMISAILVISQLFLNSKRSLQQRLSLVSIVVAGVILIGVAAQSFGYDINDVINTRILEKNSDLASAKARILSYEVFMLVFPENPFFGVGPETRKDVLALLGGEATLIHIGYLSYLYFYGLVGCFLLFMSIFYLLRDAWNVGKKDNFWGSFYGLLSFCLANLTMVYFDFSEMGIVLSVLYLRFYKLQNSLVPEEDELEPDDQNPIANDLHLSRKAIPV